MDLVGEGLQFGLAPAAEPETGAGFRQLQCRGDLGRRRRVRERPALARTARDRDVDVALRALGLTASELLSEANRELVTDILLYHVVPGVTINSKRAASSWPLTTTWLAPARRASAPPRARRRGGSSGPDPMSRMYSHDCPMLASIFMAPISRSTAVGVSLSAAMA